MLSTVFTSTAPLQCVWRATRGRHGYGWGRRWQRTASRAAHSGVVALSAEVEHALAHGHPVVALESTIIAHGMPFPHNLATAQQVEAIVRGQRCTPATVAIMDGRIRVGLDANQLQQLAEKGPQAVKVSQRDLPFVLSNPQLTGATTVAATMDAAHRAGIAVFVTGGIGGVHRGVEQSWDISADLTELSRTPVAVVCSGTKSILDIPKTLEYLETVGVPVVTVGDCPQFPAFFTRDSGIQAPWYTPNLAQCAQWIHTQLDTLQSHAGMVLAVPIPSRHAADGQLIQRAIDQALQEAKAQGVVGKQATPFLLKRVNEITGGKSLQANIALVKHNAEIGSQIARKLANLRQPNNQPPNQVIVGGSAVDIISTYESTPVTHTKANPSGSSLRSLNLGLHTSNPGTTQTSIGGVGYNVARVCRQILSHSPHLITWVGVDQNGDRIVTDMRQRGIAPKHVGQIPTMATAVYNAIHTARGELVTAVADMRILAHPHPSFGQTLSSLWKRSTPTSIPAAPVICCDGNVAMETLLTIVQFARKHRLATVFEPTSAPKSIKVLRVWQALATSCEAWSLPAVDYATPDIHELMAMDAYLETTAPAGPIFCQSTPLVNALSKVLHQHQVQLSTSGADLRSIVRSIVRLVQVIPTLVVKLGAKGVLILRRTSENAPSAQAAPCPTGESNMPLRLRPIQLPRLVFGRGFAYGIQPEETSAVWELVYLASHPCPHVVSVAGAGDSLVGTLVAGLSQYYSIINDSATPVPLRVLTYLVDRGQAAAVLALQSSDPVSPKVDHRLLDDLPQLIK
ncbi:hypothetical protein H4R35_002652 [Dimargaris xerosporica]|nr:hypothetical protein H4R35_002652 [Dimargaris xerosporica]